MKVTAVLTSQENFAWTSMQEILPELEAVWLGSRHAEQHQARVLNVDHADWSEILALCLNADNIVLICFNARIGKVASRLRSQFGLEARFFVHLHNQATIACWPFHVWGLGAVLRQDDVFISSCQRDAETQALAFINPRTEVIPFTLPDPVSATSSDLTLSDPNLVFVGRLSVQKNLHSLLYAFKIFLDSNPSYTGRLVFIGGEDGLGSPNMGMKSVGYAEWLKNLCGILGLSSRVEFRGFIIRAQLHQELADLPHIFIAPSLHSDENFGMAAFRSLCAGNAAVLTDWGGHADFTVHFAGQVFTCPVYGTDSGPWTAPTELAHAIKTAWLEKSCAREVPQYYSTRSVSDALFKLATEPLKPLSPLAASPLAIRILKQRQSHLELSKDPCKIFSDYADPLVRPFLEGYGMSAPEFSEQKITKLLVHPWGKLHGRKLLLNDPHRGCNEMSLDSEGAINLRDHFGSSTAIDRAQATAILNRGWAIQQ